MRVLVGALTPELGPGDRATLRVTVVNDGDEVLHPTISVSGLGSAVLEAQQPIAGLRPGEQGQADLTIRIAGDAHPGTLRIGVAVADLDGLQDAAWGTASLRIGDLPSVTVEVVPNTVRGRRSARLDTIVRHHGTEPMRIHLDGESEGADIRFRADDVDLTVGDAVLVPTRVSRRRITWFREVRHGLLIDVRGAGQPLSVPATFTQKPLIPTWAMKLLAVITVLAVWAAAVVVVRGRLTAEPDEPPIAATDGSGTDGGATDGSDGGTTDGGDGGGTDGEPEEELATAPAVVVEGAVDGPRDPSGTSVVIERVSFGDDGTTSGTGTKIVAGTAVALPVGKVVERSETTTDERGRFRFASGLSPTAFYRVTALRTGFEVSSLVIETTPENSEFDLEMSLRSAAASMSGAVTDTAGNPLGGAEVTVTSGDLLYRTTTATDGPTLGTWSLAGLASPATYGVAVVKRGFATATLVRNVEGGEQLPGVDVQMVGDLGTVRGRVTYRGEGVGAITMSLVGEDVERTTTTLTDEGLEGQFDLPSLPFGTYELTTSGPGWLTQTSLVEVDAGDVVLSLRDLLPATAIVQGEVEQEVAPGGCAYPNPEIPDERTNAELATCGGVGVTATGSEGTFRTTTATGTGSFRLSSIPPGDYTVAFERFGYVPVYVAVTALAGDVLTLPLDGDFVEAPGIEPAAVEDQAATRIRLRLTEPVGDPDGQIQAVVRRSDDPTGSFVFPENTVISVVGQPSALVTPPAEDVLKIAGLPPGAHTVRIDAPGFDVREVVVRVGLDGLTDAGTIILTPLATLILRVTDGQEFPVVGAEVFITARLSDEDDGTGSGRLSALTDDGVRECVVGRDVAGRLRVGFGGSDPTPGLCAEVDADGQVTFRQALGTGSYRIVTPANEIDIAALPDTAAAVRASTVPLDHQQLERVVEVRSGEVSRVDLRARRYAIIEGRIRARSGDEGFINAPLDTFEGPDGDGLSSFPAALTAGATPLGIAFEMFESAAGEMPGLTPTPYDEGLVPRVSFGTVAGLQTGVFRINRVLPDEQALTRDYQVSFYDNLGRTFVFAADSALSGLEFGETRTANALMLPPPLETQLQFVWQVTSETEPRNLAVPDVDAEVTGVTEVQVESGGVFPILRSVATTTDADGLALLVDQAGFPVRFIGSYGLQTSASHPFIVPFADNITFESDTSTVPPVIVPVLVEPQRRSVIARIEIQPGVTASDPLLTSLVPELQLRQLPGADPVDPLLPSSSTTVGDALEVRFDDVRPDLYDLVLSATGVFDRTIPIEVLPGAAEARISPDPDDAFAPFVLDAEVTLNLRIFEDLTRRAINGDVLSVILDRDVEGLDVVLLRDDLSDVAGYVEVGTDTTDVDGIASFATLRGGPNWSYAVALEDPRSPGYLAIDGLDPGVGDAGDTSEPFTLGQPLVDDVDRPVARYGALEAKILSRLDDVDDPEPLGGATVGLYEDNLGVAGALVTLRPVDPARLNPRESSSSPSDRGLVDFSFLEEVADGTYWLRVSAPNHDALDDIQVTVVAGEVTDLVDTAVELQLTKATISGKVRNITPTGAPLPNVRVSVFKNSGPTPRPQYGLSTFTDGDGDWSIPDIPAGPIKIRFEEFTSSDADPANLTETSRKIHEFSRVVAQGGAPQTFDVELEEEGKAFWGTISGRDYDGAGLSDLVGAAFTATCDDTAPQTCFGEPALSPVSTDGDGYYELNVLPVGNYDLTYSMSGYDTVTEQDVSVIRFTTAQPRRDVTLTATPVAVTVNVTSTAGASGLAGLDVTATFVGGSPPAGSPYTGTDASGGAYTFSLPPGEWTIATTDADAYAAYDAAADTPSSRPHANGTVTVDFDAAETVAPQSLPLTPYVRVIGATDKRPYVGGAIGTDHSADVTLSSADDAREAYFHMSGVSPDASSTTTTSGAWAVLLPPRGATATTWDLEVDADDHVGADIAVVLTSTSSDLAVVDPLATEMTLAATPAPLTPLAPVVTASALVLTASPVDVDVDVESAIGGAALEGVTVEATWAGGGTAPSGAPYDTSEKSDASGDATLTLAPGAWTLTTTGAEAPTTAAAAAIGPDTQPPHLNRTIADSTGIDITVSPGSGPETLTLTRYASITGEVKAVAFAGDPDAEALAGVTVTPVDAAVIAESGSSVGGVDGVWRVWRPNPDADTVLNFALTGYTHLNAPLTVPATEFPVGFRDVTLGAGYLVEMQAAARTVNVTVVSSVGATLLDGIEVRAVRPGTTTPAYLATTVAGVATFNLDAGKWDFTTTNATGHKPPHKDQVATERNIPKKGSATVDLDQANGSKKRLELTRYASVTGTVATRPFSGAAPVAADGVTVTYFGPDTLVQVEPAPGGAGGPWTAVGGSGVDGSAGRWRVWTPDPALLSVRFTKAGYDPAESFPNESPRDGSGGTVIMTATPVDVQVKVVSSVDVGTAGADGVVGVTVKATRGAVEATAVTGSTGVATFTDLAPATYTFTTTGGAGATVEGAVGKGPHVNITGTSVTRVVPVGATDPHVIDEADNTAGRQRLTMTRYKSVTGTVKLRDNASSPAAASDAPAMTVVNTGTTTTFATAVRDLPGYNGTVGVWRAWLPPTPASTVDVRFTLDGYTEARATGVTTGGADVAYGDVVLTAGGRPVKVLVVSDATGNSPLAGVKVSAVSAAVGDPAVESAITGADGLAAFAGLQPATDWKFTTIGGPTGAKLGAATTVTPHANVVDATRRVPPGSSLYTFDSSTGTTVDDRLTLPRYAAITGTVKAPAFAGQASPSAADPDAVDVFDPNTTTTFATVQTPDAIGYAGAGTWRVWVPVGSLVDVRAQLGGYEDETLEDIDTTGGDQAQGDVVLTPSARAVDVLVVSGDDSAELLAEVTVEARSVKQGVADGDDVQATSGTDGVASFTALAPSDDWVFVTLDASGAKIGTATTVTPHEDVTSTARTVPVGTTTYDLNDVPPLAGPTTDDGLVLPKWAAITGTVKAPAFAGQASPSAADPDAVDAFDPNTTTTFTDSVVQTGPGTGEFTVWVPDASLVDVRVQLGGYEDETLEDIDTTGGDQAQGDVVLTPSARAVDVLVVSGDDSAEVLAGVTVEARSVKQGVADGDDVQATTGTDGVASFTALAPSDDWVFVTLDAPGAKIGTATTVTPHEDVTSTARTVPVGTTTYDLDDVPPLTSPTTDDGLVLPKWTAITGTLQTRYHAGDDDADADADADSLTATVTLSTIVPTPTAVVQAGYAGTGTWRVWIPSSGSHNVTVDFVKTGYEDAVEYIVASADDGDTDVLMTAVPRVVRIRLVEQDTGDPIAGVDVIATGPGTGASTETATTDASGYALFTTVPGPGDGGRLVPDADPYAFTTSGVASPYYELGTPVFAPAPTRTIPVWDGTGAVTDPYEPADLEAPHNSRMHGTVGQYRGGAFEPIAGVTVTAERGSDAVSTLSGELAGDQNYSLRASAGTWRITARHGDVTTVVDEAFEIHEEGPGQPSNRLDIVLPRDGGSTIAGYVVDDAGAGVAGATVSATSSAGTLSLTTADDGNYRLAGLDPEVTWRVTYTPPAGAPGRAVSRYVAPGGGTTTISLDQTIPSGLGDIAVAMTGGEPGLAVTVTLQESGPFPTIAADATLTQATTLDADGAATVTFADLVPGGGVSVPHDRMRVTVESDAFDPINRAGVDVRSGETVVVAIELPAPPVPTTEVRLTVTSDGEPLPDRTVRLNQEGVFYTGTASAGSNVYTFRGITPGDWSVKVEGYEDGSITVAATAESEEHAVELAATGPVVDPADEPSPSPSPSPLPAPAPSPTSTAGATDAAADEPAGDDHLPAPGPSGSASPAPTGG